MAELTSSFKFDPPKSRTVIENSVFAHPKSRHDEYVRAHHFNYAVDLFLPGHSTLPSDLHDICPDSDTYWIVKELPLLELIQLDFIQTYLKQGYFYALSSGTRIDTDNVVAVLPTGELILSVSKDTYDELGLDGKVSKYDKRRKPTKYVVELSLTSNSFKKGKPGYERVLWCFKDRLNLTFDLLVAWKPAKDKSVDLGSYWSKYTCKQVSVNKQTILKTTNRLSIPVIDSSHLKSYHIKERGQSKDGSAQDQVHVNGNGDDVEKTCDVLEIFEWLGAVSSGVKCDGTPDGFISSYACPEPSHEVSSAVCNRWTGFITPHRISDILTTLRRYVTSNPSCHWAAMTVHGFCDSPVSWGKQEHGYTYACGDNIYTFVVFPEDGGRYWYISAVGACDIIS